MKKVLSVGQCNPDHNSLFQFLTMNFKCSVVRIDSTEEAMSRLEKESFDLVMVNRKLDIDYTDGTILIEKMKKSPKFNRIPVMLVSNYPEYQDEAVKLGAIYGIGKMEYSKPEIISRFQGVLERLDSGMAHEPSEHSG